MEMLGKLNPEIRIIMEAACLREGLEANDSDIVEVLLERGEVYSEIGSSHRWYDEKMVVVEIDNHLIQFDWYHLTGDTSVSDMGLEFYLSSVRLCEAHQVTVTKYHPIEKIK